MLVREAMSSTPTTVTPDTRIKAALALLAEHRLTALPVVDEHGHLHGMVSEADLIRETLTRDPRLHEIPDGNERSALPRIVHEVYTPHAISVRPDDDLADAVELMTSTSIKSLPVVDDRGRVVGVVSRSDVVRILARADSAIETEVLTMMRDLGHDSWLVEVEAGVVRVDGPSGTSEEALASLAARAVSGVVDVRIG
ncbi:CBS domain-containing protein [Nocardioides psychrotolerans]|uniref:CBS domain-containing protein n=2 Tax=Nocardioides psychrotolerans TaxID=1005945 RepID=A0A1I3JY89_9ACTN|nr:CBS domain-containing protein [Nocardioides psychrotolerans]